MIHTVAGFPFDQWVITLWQCQHLGAVGNLVSVEPSAVRRRCPLKLLGDSVTRR